ncbi:peptidoglycan-binding domain-containing protein [Serratia sp. 2723]|uniref:peptidoglycan-binding domain-containing protein n=1 Tax=unclassified Serratia (in: enterobacteria) TaxID=2647522 RepID=UPI003D213516
MASPAPACRKALTDATQKWPNRNKASDGIMGDKAHQATKSDHNSGNAFDLTHDPKNGVDCTVLSEQVLSDARVSYVIFNRKINSLDGRGWRVYSGKNPHNVHMHVSIKKEKRDDVSAWPWSTGAGASSTNNVKAGSAAPAAKGTKYPGSAIKKGQVGESVGLVQKQLNVHGAKLQVDNHFGDKTYQAMKLFQSRNRLTPDCIVGPKTWAALFSASGAPSFISRMNHGSRGTNVVQLQQRLNALGASPSLLTDGTFGTKTRTAVFAFQRKANITPDGIVGPQTWARLWR